MFRWALWVTMVGGWPGDGLPDVVVVDQVYRFEGDSVAGLRGATATSPGVRTSAVVGTSRGVLWRSETQRAVCANPAAGGRLGRRHIQALARIKAAAAETNAEFGVIDRRTAEAIHAAAMEVAEGRHDRQFPVEVFQAGLDATSNANINEVIASIVATRLAAEVHPTRHVDASQSAPAVFLSSIHLAVATAIRQDLVPRMSALVEVLDEANAPGCRAAVVTRGDLDRVRAVVPSLARLPLVHRSQPDCDPAFAERLASRLAEQTGLPLAVAATNETAGTAGASGESLVATSGILRCMALGMFASADRVEPVSGDCVRQVCVQVLGNDAAVAFAGTQAVAGVGAMLPVIARNLLDSIRLLADTAAAFTQRYPR